MYNLNVSYILFLVLILPLICCNRHSPLTEQTPYISVHTYGAKGNGKANDTRAFEKAFKDIELGKISHLYIPNGEYLIDSLEISNIKGAVIEGGGSYKCRLIPNTKVETFLKIGKFSTNEKQRLNLAISGLKFSNLRIQGTNNKAINALRFHNCQDIIVEQIDIRGFETSIIVKHSWINSFRNVKLTGFSKIGLDLQEKGLNANLFTSVRCATLKSTDICYNVNGNSTNFINCTAEGKGIGWMFGYCRMVNLSGCHSEFGTPFSLNGKAGVININGHFIYKPERVWAKSFRHKAQSISMENTYLYSENKSLSINPPSISQPKISILNNRVY